MITLQPSKILMKKYNLSKQELFNLMHKCIKYYLSEEELYEILLQETMKKENRKNIREQD